MKFLGYLKFVCFFAALLVEKSAAVKKSHGKIGRVIMDGAVGDLQNGDTIPPSDPQLRNAIAAIVRDALKAEKINDEDQAVLEKALHTLALTHRTPKGIGSDEHRVKRNSHRRRRARQAQKRRIVRILREINPILQKLLFRKRERRASERRNVGQQELLQGPFKLNRADLAKDQIVDAANEQRFGENMRDTLWKTAKSLTDKKTEKVPYRASARVVPSSNNYNAPLPSKRMIPRRVYPLMPPHDEDFGQARQIQLAPLYLRTARGNRRRYVRAVRDGEAVPTEYKTLDRPDYLMRPSPQGIPHYPSKMASYKSSRLMYQLHPANDPEDARLLASTNENLM